MDAFERRGGGKGVLSRRPEKLGTVENEEWPETLTAGQNRMAERGSQSRRRPCGFLLRQSVGEKAFNGCCSIAKLGKKL